MEDGKILLHNLREEQGRNVQFLNEVRNYYESVNPISYGISDSVAAIKENCTRVIFTKNTT